MNAFVLHNPEAGEGKVDRRRLVGALEQGGYAVSYHSSENGWQSEFARMKNDVDLLVVSGGDGTLRELFCEVAALEEPSPSILIVPNGTANNLALSLGIPLDWREVLAKFGQMVAKPFRYGVVSDSEKSDFFFESVGFGLFAEYLDLTEEDANAAETWSGNMTSEDFAKHRAAMANFAPTLPLTKVVVGIESGRYHRAVLWLEVLNSASMGARLRLLEGDDPQGHEDFSVVSVEASQLNPLMEWLGHSGQADLRSIGAQVERAFHVQLSAKTRTYHVDDEPRHCDPQQVTELRIGRARKPLMILR